MNGYEEWEQKRYEKVSEAYENLEVWLGFVEGANECAYTDSILKNVIDSLTKLYENNVYEEGGNN